MDITQNSISAGATQIDLKINEDCVQNKLTVVIRDNGGGMTDEQVKQVTDPFYTTRTTRKVGLGIPLFKMLAEMTGGRFQIDSVVQEGTDVSAVFRTDSMDMLPLGDINAVVLLLVTCNPQIDFTFTRMLVAEGSHVNQPLQFTLDTRELKEVLGDEISLGAPEVVLWIKEYLEEQQNILNLAKAGVEPNN